MSSSIKFLTLTALIDAALAAFGPAFSTGPVGNGAFIIDSTSTLVVPEGNSPFAGDFSLWGGMGTSAGDLIQSIVDRTPNNAPGVEYVYQDFPVIGIVDADENISTPCETVTTSTEWCGFAYTLFESGYQDISTQARINAGDQVQFHCEGNPESSQKTVTWYLLELGKQ